MLDLAADLTVLSMKRFRQVVAVSAVAASLISVSSPVLAHPATPAARSSPDDLSAVLADELDRHPGGTVSGNEIRYPTGETFVAVEAGTFSLSQCTSGRFCGWAQSNYSGSFYYTTGSGVTKALTWTARSYSNNRSQGARLYDSAGTSSVCFTPGQDRATIGSTYYNPDKVYLSSTASC